MTAALIHIFLTLCQKQLHQVRWFFKPHPKKSAGYFKRGLKIKADEAETKQPMSGKSGHRLLEKTIKTPGNYA
jgi:hypothetical protein